MILTFALNLALGYYINIGRETFNKTLASENNMNKFNFDGVNIDRVLDNNYYDGVSQDFRHDRDNSIVHDDGWMHLNLDGLTYSFGIGQDYNRSDYNRICNSILRDIGVVGRVSGNNN